MPNPTLHRLAAIDGLRGFAILAVLYQHIFVQHIVRVLGGGQNGFPWLIQIGWMGVGLFFVLSGFVLSLPYWENRRSLEDRSEFFDFYRRRAKRLLPLFIVASSVGYLLLTPAIPFSQFLFDISTLNMFDSKEFFPAVNRVFWSINLEIWFRLVFPPLLFILKKRPRALITTVLIVALVARLTGVASFPESRINFIKDSVAGRLDDFLVGIILAKAYAEGWLVTRRPGLVFCLGVVAVALTQFGFDLEQQHMIPHVSQVFLHTGWQISFSLLIIAAVNAGPALTFILTNAPIRVCGLMCYSIYSWHYILLWRGVSDDPFSLTLFLYGATLAVVSWLSYRFVERCNFSAIFDPAPSLSRRQ